MIGSLAVPVVPEQAVLEESELLLCLQKIGKGLIACGAAVGVVENTLTEIALRYGKNCEIMAFPNLIMIELNMEHRAHVEFTVQRLTSVNLDFVSELTELIDQVKQKHVSLSKANAEIDRIFAKKPRFGAAMVVLGYMLSCIGLTLLYRVDLRAILVTGAAGLLVGIIVMLFSRQPRFDLLLPVFSAVIVSIFIFTLTEKSIIFGPANLLITPLIIFLPGALLTTGVIELASKHLISGSARMIYGATVILLLFVGIAIGMNLTKIPNTLMYSYEATVFPWWAPFVGTMLFGIGTFIRLSGANRDLFWMLLVLYIAMLGQSFGEQYFNSYVGAFLGALLMTLSSELIARSPRRTPALVSQMLAFWFLVPGARGLLSVTNILTNNVQSAAIGLGQVIILIVSISLAVLLGTLIISPNKFVPLTELSRRNQDRQG
jgi:uncharacterized membrane protein YjjP (DUF1212 family)